LQPRAIPWKKLPSVVFKQVMRTRHSVQSSDLAAQVRRKLCAAGREIGMGDSLIAGIVLKNKGILMTRNKKHFSRIDGLRLAELPSA
jgi:predicted nucleic acid-binding protein